MNLNKYYKLWAILALTSCMGCNEDSDVRMDLPEIVTCVTGCMDDMTLRICDVNGSFQDYSCEHGCFNGNCKMPEIQSPDTNIETPKSTHCNYCDKDSLVICYDEQVKGAVKCSYGCENNACREFERCSSEGIFCIDEDTLGYCKDGDLIHRLNCENGCQNNQCQAESFDIWCVIDSSYCKSSICEGDKANAEFCDDYIVNTGETIYNTQAQIKCENGNVVSSIPCEFGCNPLSGQCLPDPRGCEVDGDFCVENNAYLLTCKDGHIDDVIKCEAGCKDNACIQTNNCGCVGDFLTICHKDGSAERVYCAAGCANGTMCQMSPKCADKPDTSDFCVNAYETGSCRYGAYNDNSCEYGCNPETGRCFDYGFDGEAICQKNGHYCTDFGNSSITCLDGHMTESVGCEFKCDVTTGTCAPDPYECQSDGTFCRGDERVTCVNGVVTQKLECLYGCEGNACLLYDGCDKLGTYCSSSTLLTCYENGDFDSLDCRVGCIDGACIKDSRCVTDGDHCLSNGFSVHCEDGEVQYTNYCPYGCNQENGECLKIHEDDGKTCDYNTDISYCDQDIILRCNSDNKIEAISCRENGENYTCYDGKGYGECLPICQSNENDAYNCIYTCEDDEEGQVMSLCQSTSNHLNYKFSYVCTNGVYKRNNDNSHYCPRECNPEGNDCSLIHLDEGTSCKYDVFNFSNQGYCDGKFLLACQFVTDIYEATDCSIEKGEGFICQETDGVPECVFPCDVSEEGKKITRCIDQNNKKVTLTYVCNNGYYVYETRKECSGICQADGLDCLQYLDNEGEACVYGEYQEKCTDGVVDHCATESDDSTAGVVTPYICAEGYSCKVLADENYANCYAESDACTNVGETATKCFEYVGYGNVVGTVTCMTTTDGKAVYEITEIKEQCGDGYGECNAEGTACAADTGVPDDTPIGGDCNPDTYVERCDGEVVMWCNEGVVEGMDCASYASEGYACNTFTLPSGSAYANCVNADVLCDTVGEEDQYCTEDSGYGYITFTDVCVKSNTDNKNYWVNIDLEQCLTSDGQSGGYCDATGSACSDSDTQESYDCTAEDCGDGMTCGEACLDAGYDNQAWCVGLNVYCEEPANVPTGGGED